MFKEKRILIISDYNPNRIIGMNIHIDYLIRFWESEKNKVICQGNPSCRIIKKSEIIWFRSERRFLKYFIWGLLYRKKMVYDLSSFPWIELNYEGRHSIRVMLSWISFKIATKITLIRVLSWTMKNYLIKTCNLQVKNIHVFTIPVKIQSNMIRKRKDRRIHFIYIGSKRRWQGTRNLIEAFNKLNFNNEFRLHCYGIQGNDTQNIQFHQRIPHEELIDIILRDMDVVVIPRERNMITENVMPLKYLEALHLNKIILATDLKVLHEIKSDQTVFIHNNSVDSIIHGIGQIKRIFKEQR